MNKFLTAAAFMALAAPAFAEGDAAEGEKEFRKCKACHMIVADDGTEIVKGGRTGPNLHGIVGRVAGSVEGFRYGNGLEAAAEDEFVWTAEAIAEYVADPRAWLDAQGYPNQSKMTFKLRRGGEDVAAYLATFSDAE
ncbi:cytochrome C [Lutimaribacter sp. EGI FJ00015]|uniref:Cytochrome C n=1 Tax=Lutimaribacter degradans TaxID=2945989 RepID=A0ACC5ZVH0_9RHOB|nr:cytochrome C [Lutimaribacter sp. EGI FJ00013]MCM2562358.1 cytochrome C [Lutimaribacter sp. EGI FJ00013]MCO0613514.1 cytochrome C [Lutimaribacter sp. EGI FJ00015]MCO0636487.1 cytochrome C [Lutimaribacter sp. EGI FJ00014]